MNIIIEDDINFYEQLNKLDTDDEDEELCLLTKMPLDKNKITLPCNHSFNFIPLYKEICIQKTHTSLYLDIDKVNVDQIKCPYCRQKFNLLLPYIRINKDVKYVYGVNKPEHLCMPFHKCTYIFNNGKQQNIQCSKNGYYEGTDCYCMTHHTLISKQKLKIKNKNLNKKNTIGKCKCILKTGKRLGEECGHRILSEDMIYCKRHTVKNNDISL